MKKRILREEGEHIKREDLGHLKRIEEEKKKKLFAMVWLFLYFLRAHFSHICHQLLPRGTSLVECSKCYPGKYWSGRPSLRRAITNMVIPTFWTCYVLVVALTGH